MNSQINGIKQNTQQVVVVIVEGISDKVSFSRYLNLLNKDKQTFFSVCGGDVLSNYNCDDKEYNDLVIELIEKNASENAYNIDDIVYIIHLTDTDGVFALDSVVQQGRDLPDDVSVQYFDDKIIVRNVKEFLKTKEFKKERVFDCFKTKEIIFNINKKIRYEIYYMSCNLEAAIHNRYNCDNDEKENLSYEFSQRFKDEEIDKFLEFMKSINKSGELDFIKSWHFIMHDNNSLKPCSNFIIFLLKIYSQNLF